MLTDEWGFVSWEERIISQERGNRVVHYFLTDSWDNSVLAVEGTERSVRHMTYVVSHRFFQDYGPISHINPGTKWRSRREVIDWLTKLASRHKSRLACGLLQPLHDETRGFSGHLISQPPEMIPRKFKAAQISDIVWNGVGCARAKQLMHYPSFCRNGITISVHSFVFIMAAEGNHYLGYLEDMYEDKKSQKKIKVRWFNHDKEVLRLVSELNAHPREVFITPHVQVISAECVGGPASVLTPKHYEQCVAVLPHYISCRVHLCFRQFKNNQIKPFSVSKLQGYRNQAVLSSIDHLLFSMNKFKGHNVSENNQEDFCIEDGINQGCKRKRLDDEKDGGIKIKDRITLGSDQNILCKRETSPSALGSQITKAVPSYLKLKIKLAGRALKHQKFVGSRHELSASFKINDEIEMLCQDSGIRGCWFRCRVIGVSRNRLKVQYDDLEDAENYGNLQEWVASHRVAAPDELGTRYPGRLITRPRPPDDTGNCILEVGAPVDVWWCDGWWEGVVITTNLCGTDNLQIYLPGEHRFLTIEKSHVRTARDWVNGSWIIAKIRPDILSCIPANASSRIANCGMPPISELEEFKEDGQDAPRFGEDATSERHFRKDGSFDVEVKKEPVEELAGCDVDEDAEVETL